MYLVSKVVLFLAVLLGGFFMANKYVATNQTDVQTDAALKQLDSKEDAANNRSVQEVASGNWAYPLLGLGGVLLFFAFFLGDIKRLVGCGGSNGASSGCCAHKPNPTPQQSECCHHQ